MRNIKTTMTWIFFVLICQTVTAHVVAIEVATQSYLSISSDAKSFTIHVLHNTVSSNCLCVCTGQAGNQGSGHQSNS